MTAYVDKLSDLVFPFFDLLSEARYVLSPQINTFPLFLPLPNNIPCKVPPLGNPDHPSMSILTSLFLLARQSRTNTYRQTVATGYSIDLSVI